MFFFVKLWLKSYPVFLLSNSGVDDSIQIVKNMLQDSY